MKKHLIKLVAIFLLLFVAACGSESSEEKTASNTGETNTNPIQEEETKDVEPSEEPEENGNSFSDETGTFTVNGVFTNENVDPETGYYEIDFDGFKLNIKPSFVDLEVSPEMQMEETYHGRQHVKAILLETKTENTNEFEVTNQGSSITVVTSDGEQLHADTTIMSRNEIVQSYYGGVKEEGYFVVPIEGESAPESIKIIAEPPYKIENGAVNPVDGKMGEKKQIDFEYVPNE